jgi:hypothetical protein
LGGGITRKFEYIRVSRDLKTYFLATDPTPTSPASFGLLRPDGKYIAFTNLPPEFEPKTAINNLVSNKSATLISTQTPSPTAELPYNFVWDGDGNELPNFAHPPGCDYFLPGQQLIDENGAMFGDCDYSGRRVTANGIESIGNWLNANGIRNYLSANTHAISVSDDGKTLLGKTNFPQAILAGLFFKEKIVDVSYPIAQNKSAAPYEFIVHIP